MLSHKRFLELYKLIAEKKDPYLTLYIYIKGCLGLPRFYKLMHRVNEPLASLLLPYRYIMCAL